MKNGHSRVLEEMLTVEQFDLLVHGGDVQREEYVRRMLSPEQIALVSDKGDLIYLALVEDIVKTNPEQLKRFDGYTTVNDHQREYILDSAKWMAGEKYLLGLALKREPSPEELLQDFEKRELGLRHRAFYVLRYPENVVKLTEIN